MRQVYYRDTRELRDPRAAAHRPHEPVRPDEGLRGRGVPLLGASLFYGSSAGSIKRSLDKLLAEGAVEVTRQEPGARGRREYGLTSLGRQKFATWMQGEVQGNFDVTGVARIYFLGLVPPADRPPIIARLRECITAELERLESVERQISGQEVPDTYRDVGRFSQAALHYGLSSTRHTYDWLTAFEAEVMKHDETK